VAGRDEGQMKPEQQDDPLLILLIIVGLVGWAIIIWEVFK